MSTNLGIRNNNWLNVRYSSSNDWVGQMGDDGNNYAKFSDPVYGLRAADRVLENYGTKHGIDNLNDAIFRFSPPADNNPTPAYAKFVADKMGISADDKIDLADPAVREQMIAAMAPTDFADHAPPRDGPVQEQPKTVYSRRGAVGVGALDARASRPFSRTLPHVHPCILA